MTSIDELKNWLHGDLSRLDKLLLVLSTFDYPCQIKDIVSRAEEAGLRGISGWNPSSVLGRSKAMALRTNEGWEISSGGLERLSDLGLAVKTPMQVAHDLRDELPKISDANTRAFAEEAIKCHEFGLYRSAIVMSWIAAVGVLQQFVYTHHLQAFNAEAKRINSRWKVAKTTDDLGRMSESDFLDRLAGMSILGKNVKNELKACLNLRNGCGHPNSLQIGANTSAHHIEVLLLNVFRKFS